MAKLFIIPVLAAMLPVAAVAEGADLVSAQQAVAQIDQDYTSVGKLVEGAWEANDQIKYSCLNAKAAQLQLHAKHAHEQIDLASRAASAAQQQVIQTILTDASKAAELRAEAGKCAGVAEAGGASKAKDGGNELASGTANLENSQQPFDPLDTAQSRASAQALPSVKAPALPAPASPVE